MSQIDELSKKTPGVYINEIPSFPPTVVQVETAVPAFIGYTKNHTDDLKKPAKIFSFLEFINIYGGPQQGEIAVTVSSAAPFTVTAMTAPAPDYTLYYHVKMFFDNGGGKCYVASVGSYSDAIISGDPAPATGLIGGLKAIEAEDEPTILVVPEAILLDNANYQKVVQAMIAQCALLGDRFAILDVLDGEDYSDAIITAHRTDVGNNNMNYAASYFPFLKTSLSPVFDDTNIALTQGGGGELNGKKLSDTVGTSPDEKAIKEKYNSLYNAIKLQLSQQFITLPPSATIAGVYANVDGTRGVWKAPANVSLASVIEPTVKIDDARQDGLNVDASTGKSINVIRSFTGKGVLVWGARTLEGNSAEWKYISVRRFFIMVEESVKKATIPFVFEPNDANTWVKVRAMIENYLTQLWREGALAGAKPEQAFYVKVGLGQTMTALDILDGRMIVEIGMAAVRPAEFIILRFSHKMQES
jgi:phage tail sheath protein FI